MMAFQRAPPGRRQADSSESSAVATSSASDSAPASTDTSSITSSASLTVASATSSAESNTSSEPSVYSPELPPPHTATSSTAYTAPGINATSSAPKITDTQSFSSSTSSATSSSSTVSHYVPPAESAIADAKRPGIPKNELTACTINGTDAHNGPICSPIHEQNLWAGLTYAITWNPDLFASNATNIASFDYVDTSLGNAWKSEPIPNTRGYANVQMSKDWLKGASGNDTQTGRNMTLKILTTPFGGTEEPREGPSIALIVNPALLPKYTIKNIPNKYGLEIGLPIGIVAIVFIFLGICCGIRKNNKQHRSIRGVSRDYMAKRARKRGKGGDIQLEDYGGEGYQDQPVNGGTGNVFRDEIAKQRQEDDSSLRRFPSSY